MNAAPDDGLFEILAVCFFGTWIALGIIGLIVFYLPGDAAVKRKWFPRYAILAGILFVFFSTTLGFLAMRVLASIGMLVCVIPATVVITCLNIYCTRFCDKCGAVSQRLSPARFCSKCGAKLVSSDQDSISEP
jgi:hypothetical protein